jgi:hypothetical protein
MKGLITMVRTAVCLILLFPSVLLSQTNTKAPSQASTLCKPLPSDIQLQIKQAFDAWEIKEPWGVQEPGDLSATAHERWKSEKPEECPGIAVGQFTGGTTLSYAVLLVSRDHTEPGYKILVYSPKPGDSTYEVTFVEQESHAGAANFFIHRVKISRFFDETSRRKLGIDTSEGILLADAVPKNNEAKDNETEVYFWKNGSYHSQPVDY